MNTPTIKTILGDRLLIRRKPPETDGAIVALPGASLALTSEREPAFEAVVVAVGKALSENLSSGDTVILAAPPSQDRVGTRNVIWNGEPCELVSTLDVLGKVEP